MNVLVFDDPDHEKSTSKAEWHEALRKIGHELGVDEAMLPEVGTVFIEGRERSELLSD